MCLLPLYCPQQNISAEPVQHCSQYCYKFINYLNSLNAKLKLVLIMLTVVLLAVKEVVVAGEVKVGLAISD